VILGGGDVAVCLLLSAHRAVIFGIAQLSCYFYNSSSRTEITRPKNVRTDRRTAGLDESALMARTAV